MANQDIAEDPLSFSFIDGTTFVPGEFGSDRGVPPWDINTPDDIFSQEFCVRYRGTSNLLNDRDCTIPLNSVCERTCAPTSLPTQTPSTSPTKNPLLLPTVNPTASNITQKPTISPTTKSTLFPTTSTPTEPPSNSPTLTPITPEPTIFSTFSSDSPTKNPVTCEQFTLIDCTFSLSPVTVSIIIMTTFLCLLLCFYKYQMKNVKRIEKDQLNLYN